jgi:hypothetical protein
MPAKPTKPAAPKVTKKELSANNYLALVAVISVIVLIITGFIGNSLIGKIITDTKLIAGKQTAVKDLDTKLDRAPKLIEAYNQLGSRQTLIMNALPINSDFPQLVSIAESMGAAAGVQVKSVSPSAIGSDAATATPVATAPAGQSDTHTAASGAPAAGQVSSYSFSISVTGPYVRILDMLKNIETSARPFKIGAVTFRGSSDSLSADIQITTYYQGAANIDDTTEAVQ